MAVEPAQIDLADLPASRTEKRQPRTTSGDCGADY
jgi:hypothetical protein